MLIGLFYDKLSVMWKDEQLMFTLKELETAVFLQVHGAQKTGVQAADGEVALFLHGIFVYFTIHREEGCSTHGPLVGSSVFPLHFCAMCRMD